MVFTGEQPGQLLWHRRDDMQHGGEPVRSELRLDPATGRPRRVKIYEWGDYSLVERTGPMLQPMAIWSLAERR